MVDAISSSNERSLDYTKRVWEIASRPYGSKRLREVVLENIDRSNEIMSLTVGALRTRQHKLAELAEKLAGQIVKRQDASIQLLRDVGDTGISNTNHVQDATRQGLADVNERIDQTQSHHATAVGLN